MHGLERMRLFRAVALVTGAFILLVHAANAQAVNPCAVVDNYERALAQNNVDEALAQFSDDAVLTLQDARTRTLSTRQQIRDFLATTSLSTPPVLTSDRHVDGNNLLWSERIDGAVLNGGDMTVQASVRDGKIHSLAYRTGRLVRLSGTPAATGTPESAGLALGAVVLLGLGLLSLATVRSHVRSGSNLRGRLMRDLAHWRPRRPTAPSVTD